MGKGKGSPEYWVYRVKPGRVIFEIDGVSDTVAKESFDRAASKSNIKTKIIKRFKFIEMKTSKIKNNSSSTTKRVDNFKKEQFNLRFQKLILKFKILLELEL